MDTQEQQRWRQHAACTGHPLDIFFPPRGDNQKQIATAKQICQECPVLNECRNYALGFDSGKLIGIFGGLTQYERKRIQRHTA